MTLTERRAADRAQMARELAALATSHGAECEVIPDGSHGMMVHIELNGLRVRLAFERGSIQPDVHVIPWHTYGPARLRPSFGDVNPHHFGKATHVAHGWEALRAEIDRGLRAAADGRAFQTVGC